MLNEHLATIDGTPLLVRSGSTGAADVVLLHGIPGSGRSWDAVVERLPDDLRPIVPDLAGFGGSGRSLNLARIHAEGQAAMLEAALAACGARTPILVGHDFGGPVALRLLMRRPDAYRGLILMSTNAFPDTPVPFPLSLVRAPLLSGVAARLLFSRFALAGMCRFGAKHGKVDAAAALGDAAQTAAIRTIFAGSLRNLAELYGPIERALPELRVPALVAWGDRDPFFPPSQAERTANAIPGARLHILEGCGHFLPEEDPASVAALIAEFARSLPD
ncbi:MAG: alpha/beta hydrolase [Chloroflexi bacterium]|nr:alpha/beta hydrolase [Chloroflexota bacterium]